MLYLYIDWDFSWHIVINLNILDSTMCHKLLSMTLITGYYKTSEPLLKNETHTTISKQIDVKFRQAIIKVNV